MKNIFILYAFGITNVDILHCIGHFGDLDGWVALLLN
jgi:hypothetical protein